MKRRSFLKLLGFSSAAVAAPTIAAGEKQLSSGDAKIREVCVYSITQDTWYARYDILIGKGQFHIDFEYLQRPLPKSDSVDAWLESNRPIVHELLNEKIEDLGMTWADVSRCELPSGVRSARYI